MTTSTWNVSASGDWSDASDWSGGVPNSSTATAMIAESGTYTVDIASTETFSVGSITLNSAHAVLEIDGTLNLSGTITQTAGNVGVDGRINGGTVNTGSYGLYVNGGTLNGVTVDGTIALTVPQGSLALPEGLSMHGSGGTGNGTINLDYNSYLFIAGTVSNAIINASFDGQRIDALNNDAMIFASTTTINSLNGGVVTLDGSSINNNGTINATSGAVLIDGTTLTNTGTIDISYGSNDTIGTNSVDNSGTISVGDGAVLEISSNSLTNTGTFAVDATSTLNVQIAITTAELGKLDLSSGATLDFSDGLNNAGATLDVGSAQLQGQIDGGTIEGTIADESLTLGGNVSLEGAGGTGAGTINITGTGGILVLEGPATLSNATINIGSASGLDTITPNATGSTTLASSVTINIAASDGNSSRGALIGESYNGSPMGVLTSNATIDDTTSGAQLTIYDIQTFTNAGTINVSNGNVLNIGESGINLTGFNNTGSINLNGTSSLSLTETVSVLQGSISGTGTLTLGEDGSVTIGSGASLSVSNWTLSGNDATMIATSLSYGGTFSDGAETTLAMTSSDTLTLTGTSTFAGSTSGAGTIALSGGTATFDAGASIGSGLTLAKAVKVTVSGSLTDSGAISQASGTTLSLGANTLTLSGSGSVLDGSVTGTGTLALSGGSDTLGSGVSLGVSNWSLASGAVATLGTTFTYAGDINEGAGTTLALGNDTLTLSGASTIAGAVTGSGRLALSGGTQTFDSSAVLSIAKWSTSGSDVISIGGSVSYAEAFALGTGTSIAIGSGDTFSLAGTSTFAGKISGAGTLSFTGGTQALDSGTTLTASAWTISGSDTTSIKEALGYAQSFTAGAGTTVAIALEDTLTLSGTSILSGTVNGEGSLILSGGTATLDAGAGLATTKMTIHGGAAVTVAGSATITSDLTDAAGDSIAVDSGATLTLSGTGSTFAGTITGGGTLALVGGTDALNTGTSLGVADWSLASAAKVTVNTAVSYAGVLTAAAGTELSLTDGLTLSGAGSTLAGTIAGAGALTLSGGSQTLNSGAALTTAKWLVSSQDVVTVDGSLTYAKSFSQASGTTLTLGSGDTLNLSGTSIVDGTVNGAGTLQVSHATVSGLVVGGTVTLNDAGTIIQTGQMMLGDTNSNAAMLTIAASGTYEIDGNGGIGIGASALSAIEDNGLLIKNAGAGISKVSVSIVDNGHIEASTGTLDILQVVSGSGALQVDAGATLEIASSAASTLTMTFHGADGTLALASPSTFAATIVDFAVGDTIDLVLIKANGAVLENDDQLLITNNKQTVATLQLSGTYTGYTFSAASDGHGGTDITATAPGSHTSVSIYDDAMIATLTQNPFHANIADWHLG